ncbi:MAG TPA: sigma-70 family RNA polymerase sigma factor [Polyangiaceae bacterium]|nr:sigma-70 family RNA polymerase sigma factor [Polyangiaceae bacterium]
MPAETLDATPFTNAAVGSLPAAESDVDQVYAQHFRYVWRCLRALGVRDVALDDAVHDVFLVVQQKLSHFDGQVAVTTWLYAIALRVARRARATARKDAWRLASAADETGGDAALVTPDALALSDHPERALERGERLSLARRALDRLDDDKREAFVLSQVEQMSAPEIVEITGLPLNTVYSRVRAARLAFQAEVARLELVTRGKSR